MSCTTWMPRRAGLLSRTALLAGALAGLTFGACRGGGPSDSETLQAVFEAEDQRSAGSQTLKEALEAFADLERAAAARAMGRIQSPSYEEALAGALDDPSAPVREEALFALGQLGLALGSPPAEAANAVRAFLESASQQNRDSREVAVALEALGKLAPAGAAEEIPSYLSHGASKVRQAAAYALFRLQFAPLWRQEVDEPPTLPDAAVEALIVAFQDPEPDVRLAAVYAFSRFGDSRAAQALVPLLRDSEEWTRLFAARSLGKAGPATAGVEGLLAALSDSSPRVRTEAVSALATLEAADELPADLAEDPSLHVRTATAQAWGGADEPNSLGWLEGLLDDPSSTVRSAALKALAHRQGPAARPSVETALQGEDWTLRVAAARAAGSLGRKAGLPLLDRALEDPDARVQAAALDALTTLESPAADGPDEDLTKRLGAALTSEDLAVRGTAVAALEERSHPDKLAWLAQAYAASPGVDWIEVREGVVDGLASLLASEGAAGEGADELLRGIAAQEPAPSVRTKALELLAARGVEISAPAPPELESVDPMRQARHREAFLAVHPDAGPGGSSPRVWVALETSKGTMRLELYPGGAPVHVAEFLMRVEEGFYDGLIWHRVVPNFVVQGGDPLGNGWGGPGYTLRDEINRIRYRRGTVGMPKAGKDTGGCQLFITHIPTPHLDGNYTVFGQVVEGLDVLDELEVGNRILRARRLGPEGSE